MNPGRAADTLPRVSNLDIARRALELGIAAIPCRPGTKFPMVKWKRWQTELPTKELLEAWFADTRANVALICSGAVLFDCEDEETARLVIERTGDTPDKVRTPGGGIHLKFRKRKGVAVANQVKVKGLNFDFRTDGGVSLVPESETDKGRYTRIGEMTRLGDLPVAKIGWTRERVKRVLRAPEKYGPSNSRIRSPESYCLKIQSVQGENGSRNLVRVVCVMRDAGRTPQQIFAFIEDVWGPACCRPQWSEKEILHAIHRHCGGGK